MNKKTRVSRKNSALSPVAAWLPTGMAAPARHEKCRVLGAKGLLCVPYLWIVALLWQKWAFGA
jgi:hypothetical protein